MSHATSTNAAHHHSDDPLETRITALIREGRALAEALYETHRQRAIAKRETNPPAWVLREKIAAIEEQLELLFSEWEARKI